MKKEKYFLSRHKRWLKNGEMEQPGLCHCLRMDLFMDLFEPTYYDIRQIELEGLSPGYWGSGLDRFDHNRMYIYTPLRQNIVLFCAAMNGEL